MDLLRYDEETRGLIEETLRLQQDMDRGVLKTLAKLRKKAMALDDQTLLGFVYFHMADAYYSQEISYDKFGKYLRSSIACLLKGDDDELLARAYNFVGVEASNNGCYDIAYHYYSAARRLCEAFPESHVTAIVISNIGQIYYELGEYKTAYKHFRQSNRVMKKDNSDIYYHRNMIVGYCMEGIVLLNEGNIKKAKQADANIRRHEKLSGGTGIQTVWIPVMCLRARIAIMEQDKEKTDYYLNRVLEVVHGKRQLFDYMDDIYSFSKFLIAHGYPEIVREIAEGISESIMEADVIHLRLILIRIRVMYFDAVGDEAGLSKALREQYDLTERLEADQNRNYRYSMDLIQTLYEFREEQTRVSKENEQLMIRAETDALCGVPNRYALNRVIEQAFEKAFQSGTHLGVEILDIDHFKEYNDTYGHQKGDDCLVLIAAALRRLAAKEGVFCARYGGDEFVIIYEGMSDEEVKAEAMSFAEEIASHYIAHESSPVAPYVTVSQGICNAVPKKKNKPWDYLSAADNALYSVKKNRSFDMEKTESICLTTTPYMQAGKV